MTIRKLAPSIAIVAFAAFTAPVTASAGWWASRQAAQQDTSTASPSNGSSSNGNQGIGLGQGGVPALRDRVDSLEARTDRIERALRELLDVVAAQGDRIDGLEAAVQRLANAFAGVRDDLMNIEDRLTFVESFASDDDGDGLSEIQGDCDDEDAAVSPLADEVPANGIDDDCDFQVDET
jgi:uncharacterized coiled-coil protein SlyX